MSSTPQRWGLDDEWRERAACAELDPELFFPVGVTGPAVAQIAAAKAVCGRCAVWAECLDFAITTNQEYGVWGGATEDERRVMRRAWRAGRRPKTRPSGSTFVGEEPRVGPAAELLPRR